MPFIGKQPKVGAYQLIDSITTSATATYALTVDGSAYFPETARNLIVSLNGVTQAPESAYTVSGSNIVFDSALTTSDVIDYILVIGDAVDIGVPSDGTVGNAQLASNIDLSGKTLTLSDNQISGDAIDGGTATLDGLTVDTSTLVVDSTNNRVGIGTTVPDRQLQVESTTAATFSLATTKNSNAGDAEYSFGEFDFLTNDSVGGVNTPVTAARIAARAKTDSSVPGGELAFYTNISGGSQTQTPFERMRIDSSGNVGIGTTDPAQELEVAGAILASPVLYSSNQDEAYLIAGTSGWTGATTNWNTFGFQHRIKTNSGGVPRITVDNSAGEVFCINNASNVGIGTSEPQSKLDLYGTSSPPTYTGHIRLSGGAASAKGGIEFVNTAYGSGYGWRVDAPDEGGGSTPIIFRNRSNSAAWTERMRVTAAGELLLNRSGTPNVSNTSDFGWRVSLGSLYLNCASATGPLLLNQTYNDSATRNQIRFFRNETQVGSVTANTTTTFYNTTSDYRVKENVVPLENALDRIKQIPVRRFNFIADPDTTVDGFIAHEVAEFVPEAIYGEKDGMETEEYEVTPEVVDEETGEVVEAAVMGTREVPEYQGIDQSKLVPLLTAAIQEQQTIIEDLQTRLSALEAN